MLPKDAGDHLDVVLGNGGNPFIQYGQKSDGSREMRIVYPRVLNSADAWSQDFTFLLDFPGLAEPLAEAIIQKNGSTPKPITVRSKRDALQCSFPGFLRETEKQHYVLSDITTMMLREFMQWLDAAQMNGGPRWSDTTKQRLYATFAELIRQLQKMERWKKELPANLHIPKGQWFAASKKSMHDEVIDRDLMTRIRLACIAEVRQIMQNFAEMSEIRAHYRGKLIPLTELPPMNPRYRIIGAGEVWSRELLLAYVDDLHTGGPVCGERRIRKQNPEARRVYQQISRRGMKLSDSVAPMFHATSRSIVPIVLLMAIALAYNPSTLLESKIADYGYSDFMGNYFVGNAFKGRSGRHQPVYIPIDSDVDNPSVLYEFLLQYTERLRPHAASIEALNLFLFADRDGAVVKSYTTNLEHNATWGTSLERFRKDNNLEYFTLKHIRKTVLDLVYDRFDGDIKAVQIHAVHSSTDTTDIYASPAERRRQYERLGKVLEQRDRYRETNGVIDQRNRGAEEDLNCATPGWHCQDPYDSPFTLKGKLCAQYGACPICPLARINLTSPLAFAYAIGLRDAINRAQMSMDPEAWIQRLGPVKKKLDEFWLPSFDAIVVKRAKKIHIPVMPMPE